jgi:hypothetical protein
MESKRAELRKEPHRELRQPDFYFMDIEPLPDPYAIEPTLPAPVDAQPVVDPVPSDPSSSISADSVDNLSEPSGDDEVAPMVDLVMLAEVVQDAIDSVQEYVDDDKLAPDPPVQPEPVPDKLNCSLQSDSSILSEPESESPSTPVQLPDDPEDVLESDSEDVEVPEPAANDAYETEALRNFIEKTMGFDEFLSAYETVASGLPSLKFIRYVPLIRVLLDWESRA